MAEQRQPLTARFWGLVMPILIGLMVIVLIGLAVFYFQEKRGQSALEEQITEYKNLINLYTEPTEELKSRYKEAEDVLHSTESTEDVTLAVLNLAEAHGFDVSAESTEISFGATGVKPEKIGGSNYDVITLQLTISGDHEKVMAFISDMDLMPTLKSLVVRSLTINQTGEETSAELKFGVYTSKE